ncbi:DNA-processing protein DprA [Staphylococcus succinus]|uniref:DNA-processing protein DprA n=1 Tax=Staphylococcus succinus TaxID=61015 RepID=UPI000E69E4DD|nr:DNA-processing protein DprA [Staphylococcus succinus]RIN26166.1 DNA-protecting protein DprA [Staphylococcus succinus]RIN44694.1 DNA-protecting protein DprA [Staphylococcus succinus]
MKEYQYLKLRFSGLTTQQIRQLLKGYPYFLECNEIEQRYLLKQFLSILNVRRKTHIYNKFLNYNVEQILLQMQQWHVNYIPITHPHYPQLLREIYDPPYILFYKGNISILQSPNTLAVIGSRNATQYTDKALSYLFPSFKKVNMTIVSGLAKGADYKAHRYALSMDMPSIAVLGFGHLYHYPKETQGIRNQLEVEGLVISEYLPNQTPQKYYFPERNRLISGLSKGILITESKSVSGTRITTHCALEQNREVYVLPGSMFNELTKGNLLSAQEGAKIVLRPSDIINDFH